MICSDTTVYEVIRCLLTKFRITDSPRKFALYEKTLNSDGKSKLKYVALNAILLVLPWHIYYLRRSPRCANFGGCVQV